MLTSQFRFSVAASCEYSVVFKQNSFIDIVISSHYSLYSYYSTLCGDSMHLISVVINLEKKNSLIKGIVSSRNGIK